MELAYVEGPITATQAGEALGETPANCSYHLRQLAKHGFIVEAPGGHGRERLWQSTSATGHSWEDTPDAPAGERAAGEAMSQLLRQRHAQYLADWLVGRSTEPAEWQRAAGSSQFAGWLTADEARELDQRIIEAWLPYIDRVHDPAKRPAGARLVWSFVETFPVRGVLPPDAPLYDPFISPADDEVTPDA